MNIYYYTHARQTKIRFSLGIPKKKLKLWRNVLFCSLKPNLHSCSLVIHTRDSFLYNGYLGISFCFFFESRACTNFYLGSLVWISIYIFLYFYLVGLSLRNDDGFTSTRVSYFKCSDFVFVVVYFFKKNRFDSLCCVSLPYQENQNERQMEICVILWENRSDFFHLRTQTSKRDPDRL